MINKELAEKMFFSKDKEVRILGFNYLTAKGKCNREVLKLWFDSILKIGYTQGDWDLRLLFVFFNFSNESAKENFELLIDFYNNLKEQKHKEDFFYLIYMASIEIQKAHIKDLKMVLTENEFNIIEENIKEYESFKNYTSDELFLSLINLLNDSDEINFIDLNHRRIETIIDLIMKFPNGEILAFIENIVSERISNYYLNSYLFYINAQLKGFINGDDLMEALLKKFHIVKFQILEQAFFIRPAENIVYELIDKDFAYIILLKYFDNGKILYFYNKLKEKYRESELFLEYFAKLFIISMFKEGIKLVKDWITLKKLRNKEVIKLLNSVLDLFND